MSSICDYNLAIDGWRPVLGPPANLIEESGWNASWFMNEDGDFLVCPKLKSKDVCDNYYEVYEKKSDGSYGRELSVCTK